MCDIQTAVAVSGGRKRMDVDKEAVQLAAIISGTVIAVAALVFDGELGYAMGTGILTMAGTYGGYIFGVKRCADEKEVQK